jgi:hypothetical protein
LQAGEYLLHRMSKWKSVLLHVLRGASVDAQRRRRLADLPHQHGPFRQALPSEGCPKAEHPSTRFSEGCCIDRAVRR